VVIKLLATVGEKDVGAGHVDKAFFMKLLVLKVPRLI
jgi:hypothetical protein